MEMSVIVWLGHMGVKWRLHRPRRACLAETEIGKLEGAWELLDEKWMVIKHHIQASDRRLPLAGPTCMLGSSLQSISQLQCVLIGEFNVGCRLSTTSSTAMATRCGARSSRSFL